MALIPRYSQDHVTNFLHRRTDFTLSIFKEDLIRIGNLVSKIPHAETGGNLFGLWTNQGNAVVLVATGPGKNCKRTSASFYQDIPYMQRVGDLLTTEYPLCHIGEWHSHHQMQLYEPSFGDCNTVQRNYPRGSQGFVLMIANILRNGTLRLSPYKFKDQHSPYENGEIEVIKVENPFMKASEITSAIENGEEKEILQQSWSGTLTEEMCLPSGKLNKSDVNKRRNLPSPPNARRSDSPIKKAKSGLIFGGQMVQTLKKHAEQGAVPHPPLQPKKGSKTSPVRFRRITASTREPLTQSTMPLESERIPETTSGIAKASHTLLVSRSPQNIDEDTQVWYETQPDVFRATYDFLVSLADDQETVLMSRNKTTLNMTMEFKHNFKQWSIDFPPEFPRGSVKLKMGRGTYSFSVDGLRGIDSFKTKLQTTLQNACTCTRCNIYRLSIVPEKNSTENRQRRSQARTNEVISRNNLTTQWYDSKPDNSKKTLEFVTSLADDPRTVNITRDKTTLNLTTAFKHHYYEWSLDFPDDFPRGTVKLKKKIGLYGEDTYPVEGRGDVDTFKAELLLTLLDHCAACKRSRYY